MKRFIRYLYEYGQRKRLRNVGFVKVEQGEDDCTLHIHGKGLHMKGERQLTLYLFYGEDGECIGIYQGTVDNVNPAINYRLHYTKEDTVVPDNFQKINGIILESETGRKYAAVWNDSPVDMEHMRVLRPDDIRREESGRGEDPGPLEEAERREEPAPQEANAERREEPVPQEVNAVQRKESEPGREVFTQGKGTETRETAMHGEDTRRREPVPQEANAVRKKESEPGREAFTQGKGTETREAAMRGENARRREPAPQEVNAERREEPAPGGEEVTGRQEDSVLRTDTLQGVNSTQNQEAADQRRETFEQESKSSRNSKNPEDMRNSKAPGEGEGEEERSFPSRIQCRKIQRNDLARLPRCEWKWANNSFLLHGYYNYHHLALIDDGKRLKLGVPGIYHPQEAKAASTFGFTEFVPYQGMEMDLTDDEKSNQEQFGYWCRPVKRPISM